MGQSHHARRIFLLWCAPILAFAVAALPAHADLALGTYIVTFDAPPTTDQLDELAAVAIGVHGFQYLPEAIAVVAPGDVDMLANLPDVRGVYPNHPLKKMLAQAVHTSRADAVWNTLGYTGTGIGVAVIDTGIDGSRADLCASAAFCNGTGIKTVQNVKFVGVQDYGVDPILALEDQINTDTSSGHGSHVAGIVGGLGVSSAYGAGKYRGVAPGARLSALGTGELLSVDNVLAAFDWVIGHKDDPRYNIKAVNNSWGPDAGTPYDPADPVHRAIVAAHDAGLSVVFGAGNSGPSTDSMNAFSVNPDAISVAGGIKSGHIAFFSSRGVPGNALWQPTVTAPGMFIASVRASTGFYGDVADASGGPNPDLVTPPDDVYYATASGTSMSSPHVAGIIALMQQASFASRGVYLTPDQVRNVLQNTAVSRDPARGGGGLPNYQAYTMGAGHVDAFAATQAAAAGTSIGAYNPHVVYDVRTFSGQLGPAGYFVSDNISSTITVAAGAISLDVMADWTKSANDIDIDLYDPSGTLAHSTFLQCAPDGEPNGYSSFCSQVANERITIPAPVPGVWRAVVHGSFSFVDTVNATWSVALPDSVTVTAAVPATVTVAASPAATSATGQAIALTATVSDAAGQPVPNANTIWTTSGVGTLTFGETTTHAKGNATASATSSIPGTQTVTVTAGTVSASIALTWLGATVPPTAASTPGRASGGGWILDLNKRHFSFWSEFRTGWSAPSGKMSFDDHANMNVKSTGVTQSVVSGSSATVRGTATVNGAAGYHFELNVTDNGSPGRNDSFDLKLTKDLDPLYSYHSSGLLGGGNLKVDP